MNKEFTKTADELNAVARAIALDAVREGPITANTYVHGATVQETIDRTTEWVGGNRRAAIYGTRITNPTLDALEDSLSAYEPGTKIACVTSCGERAVVDAIAGSVIHGEHIVASHHLFGGTISFLNNEMRDGNNVAVTYVDGVNPQDWKNAIRENTRVFVFETPTNPRIHLIDIAAVAQIAKERNILIIVDQSIATALSQQAIRLGAHVVVESETKNLSNGHGNAGIVKISEEGWEIMHGHDLLRKRLNPSYSIKTDPEARKNRIITNLMRADSLSADVAYHMLEKIAGQRAIFERGTHMAASTLIGKKPVDFVEIPDYAQTFRQYSDNTHYLAKILSQKGFRVLYPGLEDDSRNAYRHQQFELAQRQMLKRNDGGVIGGSVFSIDFGNKPHNEKKAREAIDILIAYKWSPETNFAQPIPNATLQKRITYGAMSDTQCETMGITAGFTRFSGGLIDPEYSRVALLDAMGVERKTEKQRARYIAQNWESAFIGLGLH